MQGQGVYSSGGGGSSSVLKYATKSLFPSVGKEGVQYIALDTDSVFLWDLTTSSYVIESGLWENVATIPTNGRLYNFYAGIDSRNIAPLGWHVPTEAEINTLSTFLGGNSVSGQKMKESGTTHWNATNTGNNSSGFKALGSGGLFGGLFIDLKAFAYILTTTTSGVNDIVYFTLRNYNNTIVSVTANAKQAGMSVRCIKDNNTPSTTPIIDADGNIYTEVVIGTQIWMVENLATTKYRNGDTIGSDFSGTNGAVCAYDNSELYVYDTTSVYIQPKSNKKIKAQWIEGLSGSYFSTTVYSDYQNGVDEVASGRGQSGTPYKTPEFALTQITPSKSITGTTTSGSKDITTISDYDMANIKVGQKITGVGIPYGTTVYSLGTNAITTSQNSTASGAVTLSVWNQTVLIVQGIGTITGNWYKEGVFILNSAKVIGDSVVLIDTSTTIPLIDYFFSNQYGSILLKGSSSRLYYRSNASFIYASIDINVGDYESEGTDYQIYAVSNINGSNPDNAGTSNTSNGIFRVSGNYLNAKLGKIAYFYGQTNIDWDVKAYGLLSGIYSLLAVTNTYGISRGECFVIKKPIETPTNIFVLDGGGHIMCSADLIGKITGTWSGRFDCVCAGDYIDVTNWRQQLYFAETRFSSTTFRGTGSASGISVDTINNMIYGGNIGIAVYGYFEYNKCLSTVGCASGSYVRAKQETAVPVVSTGATFILEGNNHYAIEGIYHDGGTIINNGDYVVGFIETRQNGSVMKQNGFLTVNAQYNFSGTNSICELKGKTYLGQGITKSSGTLVFDGLIRVPANTNVVKCLNDDSASKDIIVKNCQTNCDGVTYGLLKPYNGSYYTPNDTYGGILKESTTYTY